MVENPDIPDDAKKQLDEIKKKLDVFKDKVVDKFGKYISGIALMPPSKDDKGNPDNKVNVLVLVDDTDSQNLSKEELKQKIEKIISKTAKTIDKNLNPNVVLLLELWQMVYDAKYDLLQLIAMSAPIYEKGMLSAIKIAEVHKSMILKKFEKYIVSYVLAGSLVQGKSTPESDIDVFVVVDDTDVKKMTRGELKDKLRAIILGMGIEAGEMTGIRNKLNVQVYILTDFWDSIKEANPIIFTFLRDGVPFYDRGIFMPWKQLLKMGKVKPSIEAIDMYMHSGEQMLERVRFKLREIGMEDIFYAILTPSQAALMLYGLPPPTPKETPNLMNEVFVKKEKLLEAKYVTILKKTIQTRKDLEHGSKKDISGKELDELLTNAEEFLKRIHKLFEQIEKVKEEENVTNIFDTVITVARDILKSFKISKCDEENLIKTFKSNIISKGDIPEKYLRILQEMMRLKKTAESGKNLGKADLENVKKKSKEFIKFMVEFMQRKKGRELDKIKIRVKYGEKHGEVLLLDDHIFLIHDLEEEDKTISKADIVENGKLKNINTVTIEEFEKALANAKIPKNVFIKEGIFESLKDIFGKDVEILLSN